MKKLKYIVLFFVLIVLTACGSSGNDSAGVKKVICKQDVSGENAQVVVVLENGKVKEISGEVTYSTEENAEGYVSLLNQLSKIKNVDIDVKLDGNKVTIGNYHVVVESSVNSNTKVIGATEEEIKSIFVHQNFVCD